MLPFEFLGPYRIKELIGRGGMGSVFKAVHEKTGEWVAVKLISQHVADETRFRRRFAAEVEMLKRLRHRGIVRLIGYGEEQGHLFYSMELVEGESLQQRIRRLKRLDWLSTIDIGIEIASALKHAHDIGVIHRDLKPANLILTEEGNVKLVDFGIAKLFGFGEQTLAGSVLGTADYMAPEQACEDPITPRTDLYALGSVMYSMLTGRPPFTGKNVTEVIESLRRDRPVPLDLINPEMPDALVDLVNDLLQKDPTDRPPTALAVMNRLKAMRSGLLREQTAGIESLPTQVGNRESGAADSKADEADSPSPSGGTGSSGATGSSAKDATIDVGPKNDSPEAESRRSMTDRQTAASHDAAAIRPNVHSESSTPQPPVSNTHFQTVPSPEHHDRLFGHDADDRQQWWIQAISITVMVVILLVGAILFYTAIQTPAADTLYEEITQAEQAGEPFDARPKIRQFLDAYGDDPRAEELRLLNERIELQQYLRQLQTDANQAGGIEQLGAAEQAFLEIMKMRRNQPHVAREKLQHWLNVFQPTDSETAVTTPLNVRRMAVMAEQAIDRLVDQSPVTMVDPRLQDLLNRIEAAQREPERGGQRRAYEGILELFGESSWAEPALERARAALQRLETDPAPRESREGQTETPRESQKVREDAPQESQGVQEETQERNAASN